MELQWPLILFTTLLAWAAGLFAAQCLWALRGKGGRAQMPALITSAALLVVGGIAVFFHLAHWERIFNGFGHLTSGITQELIAIIVLFASLLGAACGFGPATMALICAVRDEASDLDAKANLIGQAVNVVLVVAYLVAMQATAGSYTAVEFWFDPTSPTMDITPDGSTAPFSGASVAWAVTAIVAAVAGLGSALAGRAKGDWKVWGAVGAACVLVSALALRTVFYMTGVSIYPFF